MYTCSLVGMSLVLSEAGAGVTLGGCEAGVGVLLGVEGGCDVIGVGVIL